MAPHRHSGNIYNWTNGERREVKESSPVNIEKITLSWNLIKAIGWLVAFSVAIVTITINIYAFWSQAEIFRNDVRTQIQMLNANLRGINDKLDAFINSTELIRIRDLSEFCYLLERENPQTLKCPPAFSGFGVAARTKSNR